MSTPPLLTSPDAPAKFVLRDDQEEAVDRIVDELVFADRTQAIMACGTGKTLMAQRASDRIVAANPDSVILVAVPNLVLVDQILGEWARQVAPGFEFTALPVNSGDPGPVQPADVDEDEITDVGLEGVTSDPDRIAAFMTASGRKVIFSTYQSMKHIARALRTVRVFRPEFKLDLVVADEAHRTAGTLRSKGGTAFKLVLDNEKVPATKRLFLTATPRISKLAPSEMDSAAASMGNAAVYGDRAITRSLRWAIARKLLAPYRTYVIQVSDTDVESVIARNPQLRVDGTVAEARQIAAAISLAKNAAQNNLGGVVTYHSRIAGAQGFMRILKGVVEALPAGQKPSGTLTINHINGATPAAERERILSTLDSAGRPNADWSVVTNCNCLTEGVNVPSMDAIMFVDPRKSVVNNVQAIGRPLRTDRNNPAKVASILLPVFIGEDQSVEEAIEGGAFEGVYEVIKSLRDVDDALSEMFINALIKQACGSSAGTADAPDHQSELAITPNAGAAGNTSVTVPLFALTDSKGQLMPGQSEDAMIRIAASASVGMTASGEEGLATGVMSHWSEWHAALQIRLVEDNADSWEHGIAALTSFTKREGHARPLLGHVENGHGLGSWVSRCRLQYKAGKLSADEINCLEDFAGWAWDAFARKWATAFAALTSFVHLESHAKVPAGHKESGFALAAWITKQRAHYREGRLTDEQVLLLEAVPQWTWDPILDQWNDGIAALRSFSAREGHLRVQSGHIEMGVNLSSLLSNRRTDFRNGNLSAGQVAELESIPGWVWDGLASQWDEGIGAVASFVAREGHARIPGGHKECDHNTGDWVGTRRRDYKAGRHLTSEQIAQLELFPGWEWVMLSGRWDDGLAAVKAFVARVGHARPSSRHIEGGHLTGSWVANHRNYYRRGKLSDEQIRILEDLPGWSWQAFASKWDDGVDAVRSFAAREGHTIIRREHLENGHKTGQWVRVRRSELKSGRLSPERIDELDSMGTEWRNGHLAPWESAPGVKVTLQGA